MASKKSSKESKESTKKSSNKKIAKIVAVIALIAIVVLVIRYMQPERVAATVNGEEILMQTVMSEYLKVPALYRSVITAESILEGMIVEKLLLQEAESQGISVSSGELDRLLSEALVSNGMTEENLENNLKSNNMTLKQFKEQFKNTIIMNRLLNSTVLKDITVSEDEVENYYVENMESFKIPEAVKASHILVNSSSEAEQLRSRLLKGEGFAELAEEHSSCPSSAKGGDLGWFQRKMMIKEFEDAAFALEIGDLSDVVETKFGYHIILLTNRSYESTQTFDAAKAKIEQTIFSQKQAAAVEAYTQQLRDKAEIEIFMKPDGTAAPKSGVQPLKGKESVEPGDI